jgi:hypothetical protein
MNGFFARSAGDMRLSSYHLSLYLALFQQWNAQRFCEQFVITRAETMELSRLGSVNTYARCMKELSEWGYIRYIPSSNIHSGSRVTCIRFDTASDTAGNTASDTGTDTSRNTGISCDLKSDIGRNTASSEIEGAGLKNDTARSTATDTASDTLLINIKNKNKQEEESSERNSKENSDKNQEKENLGERKNPGNNYESKFQIPEFELIRQFFVLNQSSTDEAQKFYSRYQSSGWKTADMKTIVSWQAIARKWIENNQNNQADERELNQVRTGKLNVAVNKNYNEPL